MFVNERTQVHWSIGLGVVTNSLTCSYYVDIRLSHCAARVRRDNGICVTMGTICIVEKTPCTENVQTVGCERTKPKKK